MQRLAAVMFDLDGTLLDTLADIAAGGNHALRELGRPVHPVSAYRQLAGQGAPWLIAHALGPGQQHLAARGLEIFKAYQLRHGLDQTQPYAGIPELLDALVSRGMPLAVLSNKPERATQEAVRLRLGRWRFAALAGHRGGGPLKPDPAGALEIAYRLGVEPERWLYLGDTKVDMVTALRAGMFAVGATWGFRDEAELRAAGAAAIVHHPGEVVGLVDAGGR